MGEASPNSVSKYERTPFGKEMLKHFLFDPKFKNLNHGSFGSIPKAIKEKRAQYQEASEARPDPFIRYELPDIIDENRAAVAKVLNVPAETVVIISNATTGINTVLRNITWDEDGKDEILYFNTIYGACGKTVEYICESARGPVQAREIKLEYPLSDDELVSKFKEAIKTSRAARRFPRIAIFDVISSMPGLRMPFEELTKLCKEEGILSCIDGAHGVGHIPLDLSAIDPDFFTSNCHKWLFVPRGCAVFYVPVRNQHLIRSSLPTSHGFVPKATIGGLSNPFEATGKSEFVNQFEFCGTIDNTNYFCIAEAIKWREEVCGGEKAIMDYTHNLAFEGGKMVADMLGTKLLDNEEHTMTNCSLVNILLPLSSSSSPAPGVYSIKEGYGTAVVHWIQRILVDKFQTFIAIFQFQGQWYARLSGQVYLDMDDFKWAGEKLRDVCERIGKGEYIKEDKKVDSVEMVVVGDLRKEGTTASA
ncbi:pyridoxal phosphate-dependent transferase [Tricladium varicosporioides]|nr:pyridoxal phosphate-dependent transferase [Hymenoscyphus varicosporioides]